MRAILLCTGIFGLDLFSLGLFSLGILGLGAPASAAPAVAMGQKAPLFSLENIPGKKVRLHKLLGQKVVLVVGMTQKSAPPCRDWMKALVARYPREKNLLQVVVVDRSWYIPKWLVRKKIKKFVGKHHHDKVLIEWGLGFAKRYVVPKNDTPTVIVVDEKGIIRWRHHGRFAKAPMTQLVKIFDAKR